MNLSHEVAAALIIQSGLMIIKDVFSSLTHLFLVPNEGCSAFVILHDPLYTGSLTDSLRLDIPFISHLTIAGLEGYVGRKK